MSTAAPLPRLASLLAAACSVVPDGDALAAPWRPAGAGHHRARWFSRSAFALAGLVAQRRIAMGGADPVLWLPDYFCNQSSGPARLAGAQVVHYPISGKLEPEWAACRQLAATRSPDLFVLVHYFGWPADGVAARVFCDAVGAALIEDAAHVLVPVGGIGAQGEAVFYSPHKLFALPDGALLLSREALDLAVPSVSPSPWPWLIRRLLQTAMPRFLRAATTRRRLPEFDRDPPFVTLPETSAPSRLALSSMARVDPVAEAVMRRRNAGLWAAALAGRSDLRPFLDAGPGAPYRFVAEATAGSAAALYDGYRARGCPVESWPDLAPEVLSDPAHHAVAIGLRRRLLFLPVHSGVTGDDIRRWTA